MIIMGGWLVGGHECKVEDVNETAAKSHITEGGGGIPEVETVAFITASLVLFLIGSKIKEGMEFSL